MNNSDGRPVVGWGPTAEEALRRWRENAGARVREMERRTDQLMRRVATVPWGGAPGVE